MCGQSKACVEKHFELAKKQKKDSNRVTIPCLDDHQIDPIDFESKGLLMSVAARIVLKILYLARMARPDLLFGFDSLNQSQPSPNLGRPLAGHRWLRAGHVRTCWLWPAAGWPLANQGEPWPKPWPNPNASHGEALPGKGWPWSAMKSSFRT